MSRVIQVLLMIGGILACPFVCWESGNCGGASGACAQCASHRTIAHAQDDPDACAPEACCEQACCGQPLGNEHSTHRENPGNPNRVPDPCQPHGCVCNGAVAPRSDPGLDSSHVVAAPCSAAVALPKADYLGAELLSRHFDGRSFLHLESGRAMRLVLASLLL